MSDKKIITQITLNEGEVLQKARVARVSQPNYYRIGNGTMNRQGIQARDLLKELVELSKPGQTTLMWIKDGMVWNTSTESIDFVVKVLPDTSAGKQVLKKGFKELHDKDLVRRVKRSHYMINPNALITDYPKQQAVWEALGESVK